MSAIPPNVAASVLQSGLAQQVQSQDKDAAETAKSQAVRDLHGRGGDEDILEVEATEADTQVHPDAGGLGSQGRNDAPPEEEAEAETTNPSDGITVDADGRPHLDLSA
ncbi:MAG: hypothetical protein ACE5EC_04970 [Phycisphaerae bacterium]